MVQCLLVHNVEAYLIFCQVIKKKIYIYRYVYWRKKFSTIIVIPIMAIIWGVHEEYVIRKTILDLLGKARHFQ